MMSTSFAFVLSLIWVLLLLGATILNHLKGRSPLLHSSLFLLFTYALTHLISINWLMEIPAIEAIKVHYLFYSAVQIVIGAGLFWLNRHNLTLMMSLAIFLLGLEAVLNFAVHVDRNLMALNFNAVPNLTDGKHWFLWDFKDVVATLNNPVIIVAVVLGKVYKLETENCLEATNITQDVERFVKGWDDSVFKDEMLMLLDKAFIELSWHGWQSDVPTKRSLAGLAMLKEAIRLTHYEPGKSNCGRFARFMYLLRS